MWVVQGSTYPKFREPDKPGEQSSPFEQGRYQWNPLDIICDQRAPLDIVLVEPSLASEYVIKEWSIIEEVCRPEWVVLMSTSLPGHAGWVQARLQAQPEVWHEVLQG